MLCIFGLQRKIHPCHFLFLVDARKASCSLAYHFSLYTCLLLSASLPYLFLFLNIFIILEKNLIVFKIYPSLFHLEILTITSTKALFLNMLKFWRCNRHISWGLIVNSLTLSFCPIDLILSLLVIILIYLRLSVFGLFYFISLICYIVIYIYIHPQVVHSINNYIYRLKISLSLYHYSFLIFSYLLMFTKNFIDKFKLL